MNKIKKNKKECFECGSKKNVGEGKTLGDGFEIIYFCDEHKKRGQYECIFGSRLYPIAKTQ